MKSGETVHCLEMNTGKNLTGTFHLFEDEIRTYIHSYDETFFIKPEEPIFLLTEKNVIVSLHSNISASPGYQWRQERTCYRQDITSNIAVVGHDLWIDADKVKRVGFDVKHVKQLLKHNTKFTELGRARHPDESFLTVFEDVAEGMTLKARYSATYDMEFDTPKEAWPRFEIEFESPRTLHKYIEYVNCYVQFLSFCLGVRLKPSAIRICRLSHDEAIAAVRSNTYPGDHEVHYIWPETKIDPLDLWVGGSPVLAWDDNELDAFRKCLVVWINRYSEWRNTYVLMMFSMKKKGEISAARLINACKWFEEIPLAKSQNTISDQHIEEIALVASEKAERLGYATEISRRIFGSIKMIKAESAEDRFSRLVAMIRGRFGETALPGDVVTHLKRAIAFRGKTAHGHFYPEDESEFRAFSKATLAMEAFCYFLTALDLPINDEGIKRVGRNPVVRDYREAYE